MDPEAEMESSVLIPPSAQTQPPNVVKFPSRRGRKRKNPADSYRVSVEKVSLNTYAVRIRWKRSDGSDDPGVVVNRLSDSVVKQIKRKKKVYEAFKQQTLNSWKSGTIRESEQA
jgi:hypothetical protein